jgi:hypothetical protein
MMRVGNDVAVALLERDRYRFLAELVALTRNVPAVPREVYADADPAGAVMLVERYPHSDCPTVTVSSCGDAFLRDAVAGPLGGLEAFDLHSVDGRVFEAPELNAAFRVGALSCRRSFVCTCIDAVPSPDRSAAPLTGADRDAFERYPLADSEGAPPRADLFRWFVTNGGGEILAVKDGGGMLGYLSSAPEYEEVWDVEFVHVREGMRRRGLGTLLAASYARRRLNEGQVAYWSSAAGEASERTAVKAGFTCCRELFRARLTAR